MSVSNASGLNHLVSWDLITVRLNLLTRFLWKGYFGIDESVFFLFFPYGVCFKKKKKKIALRIFQHLMMVSKLRLTTFPGGHECYTLKCSQYNV